MFKDDVQVLPDCIPSTYDYKLVLAAQIRLVRRHLPLALLGVFFTSLCFLATMFISYDLSLSQKILNANWVLYQVLIVSLLWLILRRMFRRPRTITLKSLKLIFAALATLFTAAIVLSLPLLLLMLYRAPLMEVTTAKTLLTIWVLFHFILIYMCWWHWTKVKAVAQQTTSSSTNNVNAINTTYPHPATAAGSSLSPITRASHSNYLVNYAAYNILFICTFAVGGLWALAICKALTTNIENFTQVVILMGLHFGLLSGGISSLAMFWRVYIAFALPSLFTWGFILVYIDNTSLAILAFAVIGLLIFNIIFARHTWQNTLKAILIYLENDLLVSKLQIKTRQVEQASKAKTQFLATASHDLRQPVHALSLFIEALGDTDLDDNQIQIVDYAKSASQSSREMLNTILDYAHLESGQMTAHFVATDLNLLIQNLVDEFGIQAYNKGLMLRFKSAPVWVMTDPTMLALILRNLISNAIRYTDKGVILTDVHNLPTPDAPILMERCQVNVCDTGRVISPEENAHIFDSFFQIERNKTTEQGLGLGLAIAKGMAQLIKANLKVESTVGVGSQFSIILPTCLPSFYHKAATNDLINHLQAKTVLIVDDDNSVLTSMQILLLSWGCTAIAVKTVADAVGSFITYQPDIVITDFRLANAETGEEVILTIKGINNGATQTKFIILTADTSPELFTLTQRIESIILHKPIDPRSLRQCLEKIAAQ